MNLIHTMQEAIEDGTLIGFDDYLRDEGVGRLLRAAIRQVWRCVGKFGLGELVITPGAAGTLQLLDVLHCLLRHQLGDWGEVEGEDRFANDAALTDGGQLFSEYHVKDKKQASEMVRACIVTDGNGMGTTVSLLGDC